MIDDRLEALIRDAVAGERADTLDTCDRLWRTPELPMMEYEAESHLAARLAGAGFTVDRGACAMPTAFVGRYRHGAGPTIGLLAEYDALPGLGNHPVPERSPTGTAAGHGCGHNLIAGANVGAAIAARQVMEAAGVEGTLVVLGTPAEELLWGKIAMLDRGAFDGIDALLTSHEDTRNAAPSCPCLACVSAELVFSGVSGHGGSLRSGNALDAAELTVQSMERLRAHQFNDAVVGHVLRTAGLMPSITPDEARLWITVRHESFERAEQVYRDIVPVAADAARYTGTQVREQLISASRGYLPNHTLARVLHHNLRRLGPPRWTDDELAFMESLSLAASPGRAFELDRRLDEHTTGCDPYGQDDGEASWRIPLARVNWAQPLGVGAHHWSTTALSGHAAGQRGAELACAGLALTAIELLRTPGIIARAQRELEQRVGGRVLSAPRYGAFDLMTRTPERFWDATWVAGDRLAS